MKRIGCIIAGVVVVLSGIYVIGQMQQANPIQFNPIATEAEIREELSKNPAEVNVPNAEGYTPLMVAVNKADLDKVELFLSLGADPKIKTLIPDQDGYQDMTALHLAILHGNVTEPGNDVVVESL